MTEFAIQAIVPAPDNLTEGYAAAPEDIINWVDFNTGKMILVEPNSKATVDISFKVPSSYRDRLPDKWQFDILFETESVNSPEQITDTSDGEGNIQTQILFHWLVNMRNLESLKILLWIIRALLITTVLIIKIIVWRGRKEDKHQELSFIFLTVGVLILVVGITLVLISSLSLIETLSLSFSIYFALVGLLITVIGFVIRNKFENKHSETEADTDSP